MCTGKKHKVSAVIVMVCISVGFDCTGGIFAECQQSVNFTLCKFFIKIKRTTRTLCDNMLIELIRGKYAGVYKSFIAIKTGRLLNEQVNRYVIKQVW